MFDSSLFDRMYIYGTILPYLHGSPIGSIIPNSPSLPDTEHVLPWRASSFGNDKQLYV